MIFEVLPPFAFPVDVPDGMRLCHEHNNQTRKEAKQLSTTRRTRRRGTAGGITGAGNSMSDGGITGGGADLRPAALEGGRVDQRARGGLKF